MEIELPDWSYDKERIVTQSIAEFLYNRILYQETYNRGNEKIRLEEQPRLVCEALGRLVDKLLDKNVLNLEDLHDIAGTHYDRVRKEAKLKSE